MRVEAHVHIGRARKGLQDCISVRDLPNGRVRYVGAMLLDSVSFAVQPAGQRRFLMTGQKNVHAFVRGVALNEWASGLTSIEGFWDEATYNPARNSSFVIKGSGQTVVAADSALLIGKRVFVRDWI